MAENNVELVTSGQKIAGFKNIRFKNRIDWLAGYFELILFGHLTEDLTAVKQNVKEGSACTLTNDGKTILTGYIDKVSPFYVDRKRALKIIGRSKAGDLVDSSLFGKVYRNMTIPQIIADVCAPFGIAVVTDLKGFNRLNSFTVNPAEKIVNVFERLCRQANLLLFSQPDGNLRLTARNMAVKSSVKFSSGKGGNLIDGGVVRSAESNFSSISLIGQGVLADEHTLDAVRAQAVTKDFGGRYRTTVIFGETVSEEALQKEIRLLNKGREVISLTAAGWSEAEILTLPQVSDDWMELSGRYLLSGVEFIRTDDTGHVVTVDLEVADA